MLCFMQSPIYMFEMTTRENPLRPGTHVYTQGIHSSAIPFHLAKSWSISRIRYNGVSHTRVQLNDYLIAFQHICRAYCDFLRRVKSPRFLRRRELTGCRNEFRRPPTGSLYVKLGSSRTVSVDNSKTDFKDVSIY